MLFSKPKNLKMEEIKTFISVSESSRFESVAPHILVAERDFLIPVIGQPMYDELQIVCNALPAVNPSANEKKAAVLLDLVQSSVIHLAYWIGFDMLNAHISDGGFRRTESASVKSLFKYQETNLKLMFRTNGFNRMDQVLEYLEANLSVFTAFSSSGAFTVIKASFIPTTAVFNEIVFINNSRLTFLRMKAFMKLIEDTEIAPILGTVAFAYIKAEMIKATPAAKVTALLPFIRKPMAFLSAACLIQESGADLTDNGLYFASTIAGFKNDSEFKPAPSDRINILYPRYQSIGETYLNHLRAYLLVNADSWTDVPVSTGSALRRDNTNKKTFWA
jgi:hypothetical protein